MELALPLSLEPFRPQIERASRPFVRLSRHPEAAGLLNSKLGGWPYLPYSLAYPTDAQHRPLLFIAQINFAELPPLAGYPSSGLLQFFLPGLSSLDCTVRYLTDLAEPAVEEADLKLLMQMNAPNRLQSNPIKRPGRLRLELGSAPPDSTTIEFERWLESDSVWSSAWNSDATLYRAYRDWMQLNQSHKLSGYGYFVQGDPRSLHWSESCWAEFELLLQLNSDKEAFGVCWGDGQEICFFIHPADLEQQDFSQVRYYLSP